MARARNIKPGFFTNDELSEIAPLGRLLFIALWTIADRAGRIEDRPKRIKAEALPYDDCDVDSLLSQLAARGFILRYTSSGQRFIQILKFTKHQNPHVREPQSSIPAPGNDATKQPASAALPDAIARPVQASADPAPGEHGTGPADSGFLIPDSPLLIPDSREGESPTSTTVAREAPTDQAEAGPARSPDGSRLPAGFPTSDELGWCRQKRPELDAEALGEKFRDYWASLAGSKGVRADWPAVWRNFVRTEHAEPVRAQRNRGPPMREGRNAAVIAALTGRKPQHTAEVIDVEAVERATHRVG